MPGPWSNVADAYARSFAGLCAGAVPALLAAVEGRRRLLDVGSGTGFLAAEALARGHEVVACDPEPDFVRLTAQTAPEATPVRAGLPDLPFAGDDFDAVTACFVVNHLGDPRAGVDELRRVLRPGGRLAATIWPPGTTRQGELFRRVMDESGTVAPDFPPPLAEHLDFDRTADGFGALLEERGWQEVESSTVEWTWRPTPDDFWAAAEGGVAGMGIAWRSQTVEVRARMREVFDDVRGDWMDGDRLVLPTRAVLGVATTYHQDS